MSSKEVSGLTAATTLDGTEIVHVVQGGNSRQATITQVVAGANPIGTQTTYIPAEQWKPTITNGASRYYAEDATNDLIEDSLSFSAATQQFATIDLFLPKKWNRGTITATPYWRTTGGGLAETVQWGFSGVAISNDDAADAAPGTAQTSSDTWIADSDLHVGPATAAITIAGTPAAGDLIRLKVSRNVASDNLASAARLQGVLLTYTTDAATDT